MRHGADMSLRAAVLLVVGASLLAGCARAGTDETDRQVETLATAISWPRQNSAEGFARAALNTPLGQGNAFSVLEVTDFDPAELTERMAHLVVRLHSPGFQGKFSETDPVTVCYGMDFNYYGIMDPPEEVDCPPDAYPITFEPPPAWQDRAAFETALEALLARLPAAPSENLVRNALYGGHLLEPAQLVDDEQSTLEPTDPRPFVRVRGDDIALAVQAGQDCLLAWRVGGKVTVQRPPPTKNCTPTFGER